MIIKSFLTLLACSVGLLVIQKTIAVRVAPNIEEFMGENHRTKIRQNYLVQRAIDEELSANIENFVAIPETIDAESSPGEFSSQILGCANMIKNDIIYSDDCIKTTTRKRGSIRKKNLAITVPPCNCGSKKRPIILGEDYFPTRLENVQCLDTCAAPFRCKAIHYWVTVLKRLTRASSIEVPVDFRRWESHGINVTTSCVCTADEIDNN